MDVTVVTHPLVADRLRTLRDRDTDTARFRAAMDSLGTMLCYEAFRDVEVEDVAVSTPVAETTGARVTDAPLIVPVLRAGLGLLDPATRLLPSAQVGFVGLARDEESHRPVSYLSSLPDRLEARQVVVLDPMLATGGSLVATVDSLVGRGAGRITLVCVLCAPEGVERVRSTGVDLHLVTASVDERLNEDAFIIPGLGDAGDRLFGPR